MAIILNIETSTTVCSVAVAVNGEVKAWREINDGYSHAEKLEQFILSVLEESQIKVSDLEAISVSKGPGSYTGLRIGVSLAKGMCYGSGILLISVPTLEAMSLDPKLKPHQEALKVPMLDARRMEVYACVLGPLNEVIEPTSAVIIDDSSFTKTMNEHATVFYGPGMEKCKEVLSRHENAIFVADVLPSARYMAAISEKKFENKDVEDVAYFEPFYLKDFVAGKPKKLL